MAAIGVQTSERTFSSFCVILEGAVNNVRPDVTLKSCPTFPKVAQLSPKLPNFPQSCPKSDFTLKVSFSKFVAQKSPNNFCYCNKICCRALSENAQYGHTDVGSFFESKRVWTGLVGGQQARRSTLI